MADQADTARGAGAGSTVDTGESSALLAAAQPPSAAPVTPEAAVVPPDGGHVLAPRISAQSEGWGPVSVENAEGPMSPPSSRRRAGRWLVSVGAVLLLAAVVGTLQLTANLGYDQARAKLVDGLATTHHAIGQAQSAIQNVVDAADAANMVLGLTDPALLSETMRSSLTTARAQARVASGHATALVERPLPTLGTKPIWFWELYSRSAAFDKDLSGVRQWTKQLASASAELGPATKAIDEAGVSAATAAAALAAGLEDANRPAPNHMVLDLRSHAAELAGTTSFDRTVAERILSYAYVVQTLRSGHDSTLNAEAGPLQGARSEIEDFARGLAPGVLLDFEWADRVNNLGGPDGYLSGETIWPVDDGKYSTIRLSNSVAEEWPSDSTRALVAHEVGHAITVKCRGMYDTSDRATAEAWATAWAISMGFTDDGNGTQAYGPPPASLIATAAGCR